MKKQLYILDVQRRSLKDTFAGKAQRIDASHNGDKLSGQESQQHLLFFFFFNINFAILSFMQCLLFYENI